MPMWSNLGRAMLASVLMMGGVACESGGGGGGGGDEVAPCGGHGTEHGDHCDCDPGYVSEGLNCVPDDVPAPDAAVGEPDADRPEADAEVAPEPDAEVEPEPEPEALDLNAASMSAKLFGDAGQRVWVLSGETESVRLSVELYEELGGPTAAGVVELGEAEADYATCSTCVIVQTGCVAHGDHAHCEQTYMPQPGATLQLDALGGVGEALTGQLRDAVLRPVTIDPNTYQTSDAPGAPLPLAALAFDVTLDAPPAECGGHGSAHGSHCHCDPGYVPDPADPLNCIPE